MPLVPSVKLSITSGSFSGSESFASTFTVTGVPCTVEAVSLTASGSVLGGAPGSTWTVTVAVSMPPFPSVTV